MSCWWHLYDRLIFALCYSAIVVLLHWWKTTAQIRQRTGMMLKVVVLPSLPMYCWWCWLWAATDCSGVLLQFWELPHRLSDIPSTFCRGLNLQTEDRVNIRERCLMLLIISRKKTLMNCWRVNKSHIFLGISYRKEKESPDLCFWWTGCCLMAMYCVSSCRRFSGESGFTLIP